jgi:hypothetical protein
VRRRQAPDDSDPPTRHEDHLKPSLREVAESLLERVVRSLAERHRTLRFWRQATHDDDEMSFRRSAIEPHQQDQDRYLQLTDVLIDAARDALEHLVATRPGAGARWCDHIVEADAPLLRRIAVHALPHRSDLGADEKVGWLLSRIGLYDQLITRRFWPYVPPTPRQVRSNARRPSTRSGSTSRLL